MGSDLSFRDAAKAMTAAAKKATGFGENEDLVAWRLSICAKCPLRREARSLQEKMSVVLSGQFEDKNVCDVCGCSLPLLTSARPEDLHADTPEQRKQRPAECWIHSA